MGAFVTVALWLSIVLVVVALICLVLLLVPTRRSRNDKSRRVAVLVLGDMGHSPRMQNHAMSLVDNGCTVDLIGYADSRPRPELLHSSQVNIRRLPSLPRFLKLLPFVLIAPVKVFFQLCSILYILLYEIPPPSHLIIQTPPAIPTLPTAWLAGLIRGFVVIVDWHNFGYTILGLKVAGGEKALPVRLYAALEKACAKWLFGSENDQGFTVTNAMAQVMHEKWGVDTKLYTLYDKPPSHFRTIPNNPEHKFRFLENHRLTAEFFPKTVQTPIALPPSNSLSPNPDYFSATSHSANSTPRSSPPPHTNPLPSPHKFSRPPKIIITSTSYTPDEDLQVFLDALHTYASTTTTPPLPPLLAIITGKGPQYQHFSEKIAEMSAFLNSNDVYVRQAFLPIEEYPSMLSCADLGVCLHTSSSGVDLPMKVVDMIGVGVPVVALLYDCLDELVRWEKNDEKFKEPSEKDIINAVLRDEDITSKFGPNGVVVPALLKGEGVGRVLTRLLSEKGEEELARLKKGVMEERDKGPEWETEWNRIARPVFGLDDEDGETKKDR